jgi:hypothetical protein
MGRHQTKLGQQSRAQTRPPLPYPVNDGRIPPMAREARDRRAHRRKSRLAAISAASMLAVGGAAGMSIAMADEPEAGGGGEIVFSGDCGALGLVSATSAPDSSELIVERGSQVSYRNELGTDAALHVGDEVYDIGPGSTQVFVMNRSAEVAMIPACRGLFAEYGSAQVSVVEPQADDAEPDGDESGRDGTNELPAADDDHEVEAPQGAPQDRGSSEGDGGDTRQGPGPYAGADPAEVEPESEDDAAEEDEVNEFGPPPSADDFGAGGERHVAEEEIVAVDPKAMADGANGLLALVAIICLIGVAAAVSRTLLKQRATA